MLREYFQFPDQKSAYAILWLHGLGASGSDMQGIAQVMNIPNLFLRHIFLNAPARAVSINQGMVMPAWYDIYGLTLADREDRAGIESSREMIQRELKRVQDSGYSSDQILLAGFSQGAAMAIYTALHCPYQLAGVIALSGYLPLASQISPKLCKDTPFFIGYGRYDSVVMPAWTQHSAEKLLQFGFAKQKVESYQIEHSICPEEIESLSAWITELSQEKQCR